MSEPTTPSAETTPAPPESAPRIRLPHPEHPANIRRVRALAEQAWPDPPVPTPEAPEPLMRTPAPSMLVTGSAARLVADAGCVQQAARQAVLWREYWTDPRAASPELKAAVWPPENVVAFVRMVLAPVGRHRR